ncbi:O-acetyl-ADP-ribose deacetylase [Georgenia thermotolerans]|uniref:O-acetyl-ADP-ribose deacetylase n=1 Tax=Georgenia thermotolerans TaxID=527326 RepID=A0A7J5UTT7_9MICO|nr:O-acetyl-ADP-ribose deacetylase [Georgenia thermotolerans]KAE8765697.1 O-acetyl-ADP-ribose deacetylase [Georgenia thermotolerans]
MRIEALLGDLTTQEVDAVVNAANSTLLGGGGVDGALHRAAGPGLLEECERLRRTTLPDGLPVGRAVATGGHRLPADWVIHTVGPDARRGETDPALLAACFTSSLELAARIGARTVAFPAISAGAYGWEADAVARTGVEAVRAFAARQDVRDGQQVCGLTVTDVGPATVAEVRFVLFNDRLLRAFAAALG